jgi:hypothetical protein
MGGWGEFKPGTHELTPGPWLRMGEGEMGGGGRLLAIAIPKSLTLSP